MDVSSVHSCSVIKNGARFGSAEQVQAHLPIHDVVCCVRWEIDQGGQAMAGLIRTGRTEMSSNNEKQSALGFVERVRVNQRKLRSGLKSHYDLIVCGSGSSGSVVARRLLMLSGIGDQAELQRLGISVVQHLPRGRHWRSF
jgi:GMC oxidoreductase